MRSVLTGVVWPSLRSRCYTPGEKVKLWRGKLSCGVSALWDEILATDLASVVTELALPVYFFHGIYDYTVSYSLAEGYLQSFKHRFGVSIHSTGPRTAPCWKNRKRHEKSCVRTS